MSAPSPMCRTSILILFLVASLTAYAADAPASTAHAHRRHRPALSARAHSAVRGPSHRARKAAYSRRARTHAAAAHRLRASYRVTRRRPSERSPRIEQLSETGARELNARTAETSPETTAATGEETRPETGMITRPETHMDTRTPADGELAQPASLHFSRWEMPPPMRGSLALLERQDERLVADGLEEIEDESDLAARVAHHLLVPLPASDALTVNPQLSPDRRYCRPWTARFVADLARAHDAVFHRPLEVNSAVRTVAYQERLMRINGNAAPAEGNVWSPHLMGATIDIGKKGMSWQEIAWMRLRLMPLEAAGKIDVEEEFEQACFHITVYKSYLPAQPTQPDRVQTTDESASAGQ